MSSELLAIVASHRATPVAIRERLALGGTPGQVILAEVLAHADVDELVPLATCNRDELYLAVRDADQAEEAVMRALGRHAGLPRERLRAHVATLHGSAVPRHLFAVAAGLESMVFGEAEIQGQVKRAYEGALDDGLGGPLTNRLFRDALSAGKRIRAETAIGRTGVSVSSVAVELARQTLGDLRSRRVVVIGTGKNAELTARALERNGASIVFVASRRHDRAFELARRFGEAVTFDRLAAELAEADVVLSCTASPHRVVSRELLAAARRPLLAIDVAVPRDIEPSAGALPGVTLLDMDDLEREIAARLDGRRTCEARARELVDEEAARFESWLAGVELLPTMRALRMRGDAIVAQLLDENSPRWEGLTPADRRRVEALARAVAARLLDEPTRWLKGAPRAELRVLRELFGLDEPADEASDAARVAV